MTQAITPNQDKELSKDEALREYEQLFSQEAENIITAYRNMDRLLFLLKTLGYSQSEAITKMANDAKEKGLKGFSEASIRRGLTDESKKQTKPGPRKSNQMITSAREKNQVRLVVEEEPTIPPRDETVTEVEIVREPPKPINEPLPIPPSKTIEVVFDPASIDRDRTQVFIMQIDIVTKKVIKYKTVGRRTIK